MILPYRVKNPVKKFPFATLTIIVINVLVYFFTSEGLMVIRESVVEDYACVFGHSPFYTIFTAMFLHGDLFHLIGNMLFLWVFGPPVEDRAGVPKFLLIYFVTGVAGDVLQGILSAVISPEAVPGIGASGCIMGVLGAYWYLFSWSKVCVFYWFFWVIYGVWEIRALWVIGFYLFMDILEGVFKGALGLGGGGVANFAHVGGLVTGGVLCLIMRLQRDEEEVSERKAYQADVGDINMMPLDMLQEMWREDPQNLQIIRAIINHAIRSRNIMLIRETLVTAGPRLIDTDPSIISHYLIELQGDHSIYQPVHLLRLAGHLERNGSPHQAISIYRMIAMNYPAEADAETAIFKMATCYWVSFKDAESARACLAEMQKRFPNGQMRAFAGSLLRQMDVVAKG